MSDIPFNGPVGAVRIGRLNGEFVINPTYEERKTSEINIIVVGTADGIVMVESGAKEVSEEIVADAIDFGHVEIKKIVAAINELVAKAGKKKREPKALEHDEAYFSALKGQGQRPSVRRPRHQEVREDRELRSGKADQG